MVHCKSKIMAAAYNSYLKSSDRELWHVYGKYSEYKVAAMEYCKKLAADHCAPSVYIIGHNCNTFSVGFVGVKDEKETFFYITKDYDRFIYMDELENMRKGR